MNNLYVKNLKDSLFFLKSDIIKEILKSKSSTTDLDTAHNFQVESKYKAYLYNIFISNCKNLLNNLVGYLPQTTNLTNDTLLNNISFFDEKEDQINHKKIDEIITTLNMEDLISSLPHGLNTKIQEQGQIFSGGQRQKIALARALYRETPILIFDESTSSLDSDSEKKLLDLINIIKKDRIILFITHNKDLLSFFDNTYSIEDKKLQKQEK